MGAARARHARRAREDKNEVHGRRCRAGERIEAGDADAKQATINANLHLVVSMSPISNAASAGQMPISALELGRAPSDEEIAEETGLPRDKVEAVWQVSRIVDSLDRPVGAESEAALGSLVASEEDAGHEGIHVRLGEAALHHALDQLPGMQRDALLEAM